MDKRQDFYHALRARITTWFAEHGRGFKHAELVLVVPDVFHLLCRLMLDDRVPAREKAKIAGAIAYFMSPLDLIPEFVLGPVAFLDDLAVAAYALNSLINSGQGEIAREHWAGEGDVLELVQRILASADRMLDGGVWKRLRSQLKRW